MKFLKMVLPFAIYLPFLLLSGSVDAGTVVGNFSFKTQYEFDFRIAFPANWQESAETPTDTNEIERWRLANSVNAAAHSSSAELSFLTPFPASNDLELLRELKQRYPNTTWHALQNPDFSFGYRSDQISLGPDRTKSFEFFFSSKGKVVRIITIRDRFQNGATELDTILSTIRRPSLPPKIEAIRPILENSTTVHPTIPVFHVGDRFCYQVVVSTLQSDFNADSLTNFEFQGAARHWSFETVTWHPEESALHVCIKLSARFGSDGLRIHQLTLNSNSGKTVSCQDASVTGTTQLGCGENSETKLGYQAPLIANLHPVTDPPLVTSISNGTRANTAHLTVSSALDLASGEITLAATDDNGKHLSQILYQDQISGRSFEIAFDRDRLPAGFTRVEKIEIFDSVGNVSLLKIKTPGDSTYTRYSQKEVPTSTTIAVISLFGGAMK